MKKHKLIVESKNVNFARKPIKNIIKLNGLLWFEKNDINLWSNQKLTAYEII